MPPEPHHLPHLPYYRDRDSKLPTDQPYFSDCISSLCTRKVLEVSAQLELPAGELSPMAAGWKGQWWDPGLWLSILTSWAALDLSSVPDCHTDLSSSGGTRRKEMASFTLAIPLHFH